MHGVLAPQDGLGSLDFGLVERAAPDRIGPPPPSPSAPTAAELELEWRPLAALEPDRQAWRRLSERAIEPNVFYDPAFALAAAPVLGRRVQAALLWSRDCPRQLLGFFPIRREWRYGPLWPVVTGWTHPFAPLGTPLVDRDLADQVIDAFLTSLAGAERAAPILSWPFIPEQGPFTAALERVLARRGCRSARLGDHQRAALAPGAARADYLTRALSRKRRKELARLRRRLCVHGRLELATARSEAEVASSLSEFLALEARGWKGRAGTAIDCDPAIGRFVSSAVTALAGAAMARIDRLLLDGRTLAAAITLQHGADAWFWKIAFDETYAWCSPGVQLTIDVTAALLEDAQMAHVDSCASERHPMIDRVWRERIGLCDRLIAVDPKAERAFRATCRLEAWRYRGRAAARQLRDLVRRASRRRAWPSFASRSADDERSSEERSHRRDGRQKPW
jgi:CelD/BcsL family acetyltransferase involved in cellulose biosynthesis